MAMVTRVAGNAIIDPVIQQLTALIKEDNRQIVQTDLRGMESLLQDIVPLFFRDPQKSPPELVNIWLQLLRNSLSEARRLIDCSGRRQRCLDWVVNNPRRPSKQKRAWNALFDQLYHGFQSDLSILVTSLHFVPLKPLHKEEAVFRDKAASKFVGSGIMDARAQVERWLDNDGRDFGLFAVYRMPGVGKTSLLEMVRDKYEKLRNVWYVIWVKVPEDYKISDLKNAVSNQIINPYWRQPPKTKVLVVLDDLRIRLELGVALQGYKRIKVIFSTRRKDLIGEMGAEESIEIQPLTRDEGWMLFRRVAFKDDQVPMEVQERARIFAEQCKGVPLAINIVAAVIGQTSVDKWDIYLSSMRNVDPSFPATDSGLDAQLYALLQWSYDALPNSKVKNCFLYCGMYEDGHAIDSRQLVEMWIGGGLVKSKQGTHLMDMAIGRNYLKLLVDRYLFQTVSDRKAVFWNNCIRVHDVIRDVARYIAQRDQGNCLFLGSQDLTNFPEAHDENCTRISFPHNYIGALPTDLRCSNLASLFLQGNRVLKELPSEFLLSLTSLRVLNLSGCTEITSIPTSVGQLRQLEFLSLSRLPIKELPEEIRHLSKLQFLDLSGCTGLKSLPSQIGELKNLKNLNLDGCRNLQMVPREISELTSLSRLQLAERLSVEMEAPASIWTLKGLKNLTELKVQIDDKSSTIKDGIVGNWSEMRHFDLSFIGSLGFVTKDLPEGMQRMKKLQSLKLYSYRGSSLPTCKFEHLEMVQLSSCDHITELSQLERLPSLKLLKLVSLNNLRELGMGSPSGYLRLEKLVLWSLERLESLGGPLNTGVWDERTLPQLRVVKIRDCPSLRRFPIGMYKLNKLCALIYCSFLPPPPLLSGAPRVSLSTVYNFLSTVYNPPPPLPPPPPPSLSLSTVYNLLSTPPPPPPLPPPPPPKWWESITREDADMKVKF